MTPSENINFCARNAVNAITYNVRGTIDFKGNQPRINCALKGV